MEAATYHDFITKQSKQCVCPNLANVFARQKFAASLEARCDFLKRELNPDAHVVDDLQYLTDYRNEIKKFKDAVQAYHALLYQRAAEGRAYFALHDAAQNKVIEHLPLERAQGLLREGSPLISIHCSRCDQQIDVAAPYMDDDTKLDSLIR